MPTGSPGVGELGAAVRDELVLGRAAEDELGPVEQLEPQLGEMARRVVGDAEVDEREPLRAAALHLVDRAAPGVDVDVRRRRRRHHVTAGLDAHTRGVARVQRAVSGRDTRRGAMRAPASGSIRGRRRCRRRRARSPAARARARPRACRTCRRTGAARCARAARVDEVRRADLGDVHLQRRMLAHEHAGCARVVEMDVAEQEVADVGQLQPSDGKTAPPASDRRLQGRSRRARPSSVSST